MSTDKKAEIVFSSAATGGEWRRHWLWCWMMTMQGVAESCPGGCTLTVEAKEGVLASCPGLSHHQASTSSSFSSSWRQPPPPHIILGPPAMEPWQFVSWLEMPELCASDPSGRTSCAPVADGWAYCAVQQAGRSCLSCKEESCSCTTLTTSPPNQDSAPENFWQTARGNLVKILDCDEAAGWVKRVAWSTLDSCSSTMLLMPKTRY